MKKTCSIFSQNQNHKMHNTDISCNFRTQNKRKRNMNIIIIIIIQPDIQFFHINKLQVMFLLLIILLFLVHTKYDSMFSSSLPSLCSS